MLRAGPLQVVALDVAVVGGVLPAGVLPVDDPVAGDVTVPDRPVAGDMPAAYVLGDVASAGVVALDSGAVDVASAGDMTGRSAVVAERLTLPVDRLTGLQPAVPDRPAVPATDEMPLGGRPVSGAPSLMVVDGRLAVPGDVHPMMSRDVDSELPDVGRDADLDVPAEHDPMDSPAAVARKMHARMAAYPDLDLMLTAVAEPEMVLTADPGVQRRRRESAP